MRRIHPEPGGPASLDELYGLTRTRVGDRPWAGLCMVTSLDGSVVVDGRSGGLSNANDSSVLARLRAAADVIIVGASTVRSEGYGPPSKDGQRIGVVSTRGDVDLTSALFTSGSGFLILPEDAPPLGPVDTVRAGSGRVDVGLALRRLSDVVADPTFVQAEGGPHLNGSLLDADCVDELDLTISPVLVGGDGTRLTSGATAATDRFELAHIAVDQSSYLFTRWVRRRDALTEV